MKPMRLSVVIIAKNAEKLIADAIDSVTFADEILVVDGGSTDATVAVAKKHGARVIKSENKDFAQQRNVGLKLAKSEWIFYIDTDERVSKELAESVKFVIASEAKQSQKEIATSSSTPRNDTVAYKIKRQNYYLGKNKWPKIEELERLFRKDSLKGWYGKLHETPEVTGKIGQLDGYLLHFTHRDLAGMVDKTNEWSETEAALRIDAHHPRIVSWRFIRVMITSFIDSYIMQGGWKAGTMGFIESMYQSYSMFVTYAKLWEKQQKKS